MYLEKTKSKKSEAQKQEVRSKKSKDSLTLASLLLTSLLLAAPLHAVPAESKRFIPYFSMRMSQSGYLPSKGDFFTGADMGMNVGLLSKITDNHAILTLYNLGFVGETFRFQDTQEFASKELAHFFESEYRWQVLESVRLRPAVTYSLNFTRTAAGEIWGEGLYDSKAVGGQLAGDYTFDFFSKKATLTGQWLYRDLRFPNYTDIIREFQGLSTNVELAGGLKDQTLQEFSASIYWNKIFSRFRYNFVNFKNEKVVESNGTYGNTAQKDNNVIFTLGFDTKLWIFELAPEAGITRHQSNQNFLLFKSVTDPSPTFAANYYDYTDYNLSVPLTINFTKKWGLYGGIDYRNRNYSDRQPRDESNQFISGKTQTNNWVAITAGIRKKMNAVSALFLTYTSVVATSNNRFERYLPYNYSGQKIAIAYQITY